MNEDIIARICCDADDFRKAGGSLPPRCRLRRQCAVTAKSLAQNCYSRSQTRSLRRKLVGRKSRRVDPNRWLSPTGVWAPADRFCRVSCPATRPYAPLFSEIFRKIRPFTPPRSPKAPKTPDLWLQANPQDTPLPQPLFAGIQRLGKKPVLPSVGQFRAG
jgi:hypothetical protein